MAGRSKAAEVEAQLMQELRAGVERLLEEQERLVARFAREWRTEDAKGAGHVKEDTESTSHAENPQAACHAASTSFPASAGTSESTRNEEAGAQAHLSSEPSESFPKRAASPERSGGAAELETERLASRMSSRMSYSTSSARGRPRRRYASRVAETITLGGFDMPSEDEDRLFSSNPFARVFWRLRYFISRIEEPERTGQLARIVQSRLFEVATLVVILLNGVMVLFQTEDAARLAWRDSAGQQLDSRGLVFVLDQIFTAYFVTEILFRLLLHRLYFFVNADWFWNIFDLTIIATTVVDLLMSLISDYADTMDATLLRVLRIFRMFRSLRLVRALHFVRPLRQLIECMVSSLAVVVWCLLLLFLITGTFATFLVQCVTAFLMDSGRLELAGSEGGPEALAALSSNFGSIVSAMWALFKATSGGEDWGIYYNVLELTGVLAPFVYTVYIIFFFIAAWNIVSSLFMEKVMSLAQPDMDQQLLTKRRQDMADAKDLRNLLETMDHEKSGTISVEEFKRSMARPRFRHFFELRSIDIKDAEAFFAMLEAAAGTSRIGLDFVVNGLMRMRGLATSIDLQALQFQLEMDKVKAGRSLKDLMEMLKGVAAELRKASTCEVSRKVFTVLEADVYTGEEAMQHKACSVSGCEEDPPDCQVRTDSRRSEAMASVERDIEELAMNSARALPRLGFAVGLSRYQQKVQQEPPSSGPAVPTAA